MTRWKEYWSERTELYMEKIIMKVERKMVYIIILIVGILAVINMLKTNSLVNGMLQQTGDQMEPGGFKFFMCIVAVCSLVLVVLLLYKYFIQKEKEHIYAIGIICSILLLLTAYQGFVYFSGADGGAVNEAGVIRTVKAFIYYLGVSKLSGYSFLATMVCAGYLLFKDIGIVDKNHPKKEISEAAPTDALQNEIEETYKEDCNENYEQILD